MPSKWSDNMKMLAIESSGMTASVAVATKDCLIGEYTTNYKKTHSQTLLPMIDELLRFINMEKKEIDIIGVSSGPGSFTGLRIGSATAKGIAMALNIPIVTVPTLEAMAYNFEGYTGAICPMMDARRSRVYAGIYEFVEGELVHLHPQDVDDVDVIIDKLNELGKNVILMGDGSSVYGEHFKEKLNVPYTFAPFQKREQSATAVAACAFKMYEKGQVDTAKSHKPIYLRPSQAEMEKMERESGDKK